MPWTREDVEKFLKSRGGDPANVDTTKTDTPDQPESGSLREAIEDQFNFTTGIGKGIARGASKFGGNVAGMLGKKIPEGMQQFADEPPEGAGEEFGGIIGEYGPPSLVGGGLGALASRAIGGTLTPWAAAAMSRVNAMRQPFTRPAAAARSFLGGLAGTRLPQLAGAVAGGAAGGALMNPEQPGLGALAGAAASPAGNVIGKGMASPFGREVGGHAARGIVAYEVYRALKESGVPGSELAWAIALPNIRWLRSPVGRRLNRLGDRLVGDTGEIIAILPPGLTGGAAGAATRDQ